MVKPFVSQAAYEDTGVTLMARITDTDGNNLTQSDVSSIELKVIKLSDGTTVTTVALTVSVVIFDTLQTTALLPAWSLDSTGANFVYKTLDAHLPDGEETYRFQVRITPASGATIQIAYDVPTVQTYA